MLPKEAETGAQQLRGSGATFTRGSRAEDVVRLR
jgi:hypothetical protein